MTYRRKGRKRGVYKRRSGPPYVSCGECINGWVAVGGGMKRCWCFTSHQRKLDDLAAEKAS